MVICLEQGVDLHMAQLMPLPLTVSCFSKIQIGFTFLIPAHPGSPGKRAVKHVCVFLLRNKFSRNQALSSESKHKGICAPSIKNVVVDDNGRCFEFSLVL